MYANNVLLFEFSLQFFLFKERVTFVNNSVCFNIVFEVVLIVIDTLFNQIHRIIQETKIRIDLFGTIFISLKNHIYCISNHFLD